MDVISMKNCIAKIHWSTASRVHYFCRPDSAIAITGSKKNLNKQNVAQKFPTHISKPTLVLVQRGKNNLAPRV